MGYITKFQSQVRSKEKKYGILTGSQGSRKRLQNNSVVQKLYLISARTIRVILRKPRESTAKKAYN